ncbi:hypothetical protein GCM10009554_09120 [Kribbella koreensis]|uniref:DUF2231 domain-containing protein n=1 Tax=Kribbella koreensis TaxID=57909 RepID=A0ABN1PGL4_9ACTN
MTTVNGLPAHVLLVHAIVVLLPLSALLLILTALWAPARSRLAGPNALLSLVVLALVPITTSAGEWLEHRVASTELIRAHTELGDTAVFVAIGVAVMALAVWWRGRESRATSAPAESASTRRTFLAPASAAVTAVIAVLSIVAGGVAVYDVYRIGDSGAKASWDGKVGTAQPAR